MGDDARAGEAGRETRDALSCEADGTDDDDDGAEEAKAEAEEEEEDEEEEEEEEEDDDFAAACEAVVTAAAEDVRGPFREARKGCLGVPLRDLDDGDEDDRLPRDVGFFFLPKPTLLLLLLLPLSRLSLSCEFRSSCSPVNTLVVVLAAGPLLLEEATFAFRLETVEEDPGFEFEGRAADEFDTLFEGADCADDDDDDDDDEEEEEEVGKDEDEEEEVEAEEEEEVEGNTPDA